MTLWELGERAGGVDYTAVAMALKRFASRASHNDQIRADVKWLESICEK
jgi:hypothetical protein